jgi:hypothetical protein
MKDIEEFRYFLDYCPSNPSRTCLNKARPLASARSIGCWLLCYLGLFSLCDVSSVIFIGGSLEWRGTGQPGQQ